MRNFFLNSLVTLLLTVACWSAFQNTATAANAAWNSTSNGNWADMANWNPNTTFPNGIGQIATFGAGGFSGNGQTRTVTVNTDITLGTLTLQNPASSKQYVIAGPNKLTFDVASGNARINSVVNGVLHTISAPVEIADTIDVNITAAVLQMSGPISGTVGNPNVTMNLIDDSTLRLSGNNNFGTGTLNINNGTLQLYATSTGLNNTGGGAGTTVKINGGALTLGGVGGGTSNFQVDVEATGANVTLNSDRSDSSTTATNQIGSLTVRAGNTLAATNSIGRGFSLAIGAGEMLTVEENATLNWTRTPNANFSADLIIRNGATVRGTGTINTNNGHQGDEFRIQSGGKLAPGLSAGILHIGTGSGLNTRTILESGSILEMEIFGAVAGLGYDQIEIQGNLTITGATLNLIDNGFAFDPEAAATIWLVNNTSTGTLTGEFSGLANGAFATTIGGRSFSIHYGADFATNSLTGGNDIALFSLGVPEPGTGCLLLLGLVALRLRRKNA